MEEEAATAETEATEVLHALLSVERINGDKNIRGNSKEGKGIIAQKKSAKNLKKSVKGLLKDQSIVEAKKVTKIIPGGFAQLSDNEDVDEINILDINDPFGETTGSQEHKLTCSPSGEKLKIPKKDKRVVKGKQKRVKGEGESSYEPTRLEDNAVQVLERFKRGCECQDDQCFSGLNPESVYRHRLNIAELTKAEHDMYLMGVTMACLTNPYQTARHTERRRLRAQYVYQGRRVCLDAFLYLENCTHYQIKRIRKHLITQGVTPRVHGNHGKVPHNTFSLDIYKIATEFLKNFINQQEARQKANTRHGPLHLASDVTRKTVHDLYTNYCKKLSPSIKIMGYSTFRRFMKVQFPQVKFAKVEFIVKGGQQNCSNNNNNSDKKDEDTEILSPRIINDPNEILPLVIAHSNVQQNGAYLLTPVNKLQEGVSYQLTSSGFLVKSSDVHSSNVTNTATM